MLYELGNMSPIKRMKFKEDIPNSNDVSRYAEAVKLHYPLLKIHYKITKDYLDLPDVDKSYTDIYPTNTFNIVSINFSVAIKKSELPEDEQMDYNEIVSMCKDLYENDIENCFRLFDQITINQNQIYQRITKNKDVFSTVFRHMRTVFPIIFDQLSCLIKQSDEQEINGEVFSKLLLLCWKIINDTTYQYKFNIEYRTLSKIILIEYLIQSNSTCVLSHSFQYRIKQIMEHNSPLNKFLRKMYMLKLKHKKQIIL